MFGLIPRIFTQVASYASIIGLYFSTYPISGARPPSHWYIITLVSIALLFVIGREIWEHNQQSFRKFRTDKGINSYMCRLIAKEGRTVIFSRDLSWGEQDGAKKALLKKATAGELTIYLHHATALSRELANAGGSIVIYGQEGLEPRSRFTMIGFGKEGSRVAVGTKRRGRQVVYEFDSGEHPVHALAEDLIRHLGAGA